MYYNRRYAKGEDRKMIKVGTVTISVFKNEKNVSTSFDIETSNDDVLPVSYVIEDVLKYY